MTDTIFTEGQQTNEPSTLDNTSKYSSWDVQDLIKKAEAADIHITKLETENADYRTKNDETLKKVLEKLDQANQTTATDPSTLTHQSPEQSNPSGALKPEDIQKMVSESFERKQKETLAKSNVERIRTELKKTWGDNYVQRLNERKAELGVDQSYLESTAENYPDVFLKIILGETKYTNPNTHVPPSNPSIAPNNSNQPVMSKFSEFRKMEKENPALRHDAVFQTRKLEAAARYGPEFYK
jgi:hypothetical protein